MLNILLPTLFFCATAQYSVAETTVDVLILGGGISGITAANHLDNNDVKSFLVLEAQDYIGGRLKNIVVGNTTVGEGANWISFVDQGNENPILVIADKLKLAKHESDYNDIIVRNAIDNDTDFEAVQTQLDAAAAKVEENQKKATPCEDRPLHSSLADVGWLADTPLKSAVEWNYYDYEYATNTKEISTKQFAESSGTDTDSIVTDQRGYATIIQYLAQNFTDKVKTSHVVQSISYTSNGVEIQTKNGSTFKAKYALCTFSAGVLADQDFVKFIPALPPWKIKAINNLPLGYFTLVNVRFQHVFWDDHEFLLNAGHIRGKFPIIMNRNQKNVQPGSNLLLFVAIGDDAQRTEMQDQSKTVDEVMETLKEMYPAANISRPTNIAVSKWVTNPYVRGSYSNPVVGSSKADFHNLAGRVGNLFFAGEASSEKYYGFLQGGYFSGLEQAKAIINCLKKNDCPEYEPEVPEDRCGQIVNGGDSGLITNNLISVIALVTFHALF